MLSQGITDKMVPSQEMSSQDIRARISVSDHAKSFIVTSKIMGLEADSQQPNVAVSIGSCGMETKAH